MSRPTKYRRICKVPDTLSFIPVDGDINGAEVILTLDEYETIRLIDLEGRSQEECSEQMNVSRTTVQKIYETARKKTAQMLINGLPLKIGGGEYTLCDGRSHKCTQKDCQKRRLEQEYSILKGDNTMRIAVTYEDGMIFQHFGHTEYFKIYDVENGKISESRIISTNGQGHGALAQVLKAVNADILICGGIGGGAKMALSELGIKLYGGASGNADKAVEAFLSNELNYDPNVKCNHHEHEQEHTCGSHGCGKGNCGNH